MNISFIIITNAGKPDKLLAQIESIHAQKIPNYEIIVSGDKKDIQLPNKNLTFVEAIDDAKNGDLGAMRNKACSAAQYDNLVISDDDIRFSQSWYSRMCKHKKDFDILTPKVLLPDGTRFWDHCCYQSPKNGHSILEPDESDNFLYMSGGTGWTMKSYVYKKVKWAEGDQLYTMKNLNDYKNGKHNEDTDFAQKCRQEGFVISHDSKIEVLHDDPSYTCVGRLVRKRMHQDHSWCADLKFPNQIKSEIAKLLWNYGIEAEAIDLLRYNCMESDLSSNLILDEMERSRGGKLSNSNFNINEQLS